MGQPLKIEDSDAVFLITTRTIASRLWFINNKSLDRAILSYLARYAEFYGVVVYSFIIMGNHYHLIAKFPGRNKKHFCRDFNAIIAKLTQSHVESFEGKLWARRYADQFLPNHEDVEHYFYYCALNPVSSGLTKDYRKYSSYNSFMDAAQGNELSFQVFEKSAYNEAIRRGKKVAKEDFKKIHKLRFARLPGYAELPQDEYRNLLLEKITRLQRQNVEERLQSGKGFAPEDYLMRTEVGAKPKSTKKSDRFSIRPIVLCSCKDTRDFILNWYFSVRDKFMEASKKFRSGDLTVEFPPGTYRPLLFAP